MSSFVYNHIPTEIMDEDGFYNFSDSYHKSYWIEQYDQGTLTKIYREWPTNSGFDKTAELTTEDIMEMLQLDSTSVE